MSRRIAYIWFRHLLTDKLLLQLARTCFQFTPSISLYPPDGLVLDVTGCAHLWNGEEQYHATIAGFFSSKGLDVRIAIAGSIGAAWAVARYCRDGLIVPPERQRDVLLALPPAALRLDPAIIERMSKLGLQDIGQFAGIARGALRRRFGESVLIRLDQAFGYIEELLPGIQPPERYEEMLPCLEPIRTRGGIDIALERLLTQLCGRLERSGKGIRTVVFRCDRVDGTVQSCTIGTAKASTHVEHLMKLFEERVKLLEPDLGFELFGLEATVVEDVDSEQSMLWEGRKGLTDRGVAELVDKINNLQPHAVSRWLPSEHHWPERSAQASSSMTTVPHGKWPIMPMRPVLLLPRPEPIEVMAAVPDYPPKMFRYKGTLHSIVKADGPERIEREWWIEKGTHRDYYVLEDADGARYWVYRHGHGEGEKGAVWLLHGFFA